VHFSGMRQGEELATHYASADLFLFPSLTETFGNVVTEALASGLPVVAYAHAAAGDLVIAERTGLLAPPGDAAAFIAASRNAARHVANRAFRRSDCVDSVKHLGWERIHDSYAAMLEEVAARQPQPATAVPEIRFAPD
jgi:glycosyltransferase involved in cell wall biosynthesis